MATTTAAKVLAVDSSSFDPVRQIGDDGQYAAHLPIQGHYDAALLSILGVSDKPFTVRAAILATLRHGAFHCLGLQVEPLSQATLLAASSRDSWSLSGCHFPLGS